MCHPGARGDGSIADDVYALGVLLLIMALGRLPLAGMDEAAILCRKLELGSHAALIGEERLPPVIGDLVRGMLAEDPEHRPTPVLLLDPAAARSRRVAARPPRRAQRALTVAGVAAWDARTLAYAIALEPEPGLAAVRGGAVVQWLRRGLGDALLAVRFEELIRHRGAEAAGEEPASDGLVLMRAVAMLDPLAPLCWRGIALWPEGIGPALAVARREEQSFAARLQDLVATEAFGAWGQMRAERCDVALLRVDARQHRAWLETRGPAGGLARLAYMLNPLLPCGSKLVADRWVGRLADLPPALEAAARRTARSNPIDNHIAAFVAAHADRRLDNETNALTEGDGKSIGFAELRLLAQLQVRFFPHPLPALAAWVAADAAPLIEDWHNRGRRKELSERLADLAQAGMLTPMLALLEDPPGHLADAQAARLAAAELQQIDIELQLIATRGDERGHAAERIGQEFAAGVGLAALAAALIMTALG
jgi:hypothetical protein